jgi:hypothetical protein
MPPAGQKRKLGTMHTTVASDSESEGEAGPSTSTRTPREEILHHRSLQEDRDGRTQIVVSQLLVPGSPGKRRAPERDMLEPDEPPASGSAWAAGDAMPFPFGGEDFFAFDEGHPLEHVRRKERESVRFRVGAA